MQIWKIAFIWIRWMKTFSYCIYFHLFPATSAEFMENEGKKIFPLFFYYYKYHALSFISGWDFQQSFFPFRFFFFFFFFFYHNKWSLNFTIRELPLSFYISSASRKIYYQIFPHQMPLLIYSGNSKRDGWTQAGEMKMDFFTFHKHV